MVLQSQNFYFITLSTLKIFLPSLSAGLDSPYSKYSKSLNWTLRTQIFQVSQLDSLVLKIFRVTQLDWTLRTQNIPSLSTGLDSPYSNIPSLSTGLPVLKYSKSLLHSNS